MVWLLLDGEGLRAGPGEVGGSTEEGEGGGSVEEVEARTLLSEKVGEA